ncbi:hypothetical protein CYY_001506 [Polysphondylium violaceum]|uniref:Uncharacterized protein n=1 Tax=Polysphondylium violaceum TaxID=133409 RepID=A0A8J4Q1T5_9MYCE|nr:hypothetical protein CYY_001506 [Polysphondylium violaceum]
MNTTPTAAVLVEYSDSLKQSLQDFVKQENKKVTPELFSIIENVAKTGATCYPWELLKELLYFKLNEIFDIFKQSYIEQQQNQSYSPQSPSSNVNNNNKDKDEEMTKIKNQMNTSTLLQMQQQFLDTFMEFKEPPFTIQRLCELILDYKLYTSFSKYLCAVEKMANVTSTLPPLSTPDEVAEYNKNIWKN